MNQELPIDLRKLKRIVMRRVYVIWLFRQAPRSTWLKLTLLVFLFWQMLVHVSPIIVWHNAVTSGGLTNYGFFWDALIRTETTVQFSLLAALAIFLWLMKDLWPRFARLLNLSSRPEFFSQAHF